MLFYEHYRAKTMTKEDLLSYFDDYTDAAKGLGITKGAISQWKGLIPIRHARKVEQLSDGAIRVNPDDYKKPRDKSKCSASLA